MEWSIPFFCVCVDLATSIVAGIQLARKNTDFGKTLIPSRMLLFLDALISALNDFERNPEVKKEKKQPHHSEACQEEVQIIGFTLNGRVQNSE